MSAMNTYWYRVMLADGSTQRGLVRLAVERDFSARIWLERKHDAVVLSLRRLPSWVAGTQEIMSRPFRERVSLEDLAGFLRDLALMVGAGVPILEALRTIESEGAMGEQRRLVGLSKSLLDDLSAGASVSDAFGRHTDVFPESVCNLVAIGEKSGKLDKMLLEGADHIERLMRINRDIRSHSRPTRAVHKHPVADDNIHRCDRCLLRPPLRSAVISKGRLFLQRKCRYRGAHAPDGSQSPHDDHLERPFHFISIADASIQQRSYSRGGRIRTLDVQPLAIVYSYHTFARIAKIRSSVSLMRKIGIELSPLPTPPLTKGGQGG